MAKQKAGSGFSLKDQLFNRERVQYLGGLFHAADASFDDSEFVRQTMRDLTKLELKERIIHIAATLENYLAADFRVASEQILTALPPPLDPSRSDDDFGDFIFAPLGEYVVRNGMAKRHVKRSLKTLKTLTMRFSMEDAIRSFINTHTDTTMSELQKWATDSNYHVRRLVSEGTRPRLPWSGRVVLEATAGLSLLETLHADPTRYVTRSVANHLNDLSKTDPAEVLKTLKRWRKLGAQEPAELDWMTRHALRTLVKQGNHHALELLGFRRNPKIQISEFGLVRDQVEPGDSLEFAFTVSAARAEALLIDYVIDYVKANGATAPKVHKLKQVTLNAGQSLLIQKKHLLKANATTYKLYPGMHRLTLQINGQQRDQLEFCLGH